MTGLVRKATLMGVCGLLAAATAFANVPSPAHSTVPSFIPVVTSNPDNTPHAGFAVTITVRDFSNNPVANADMEIDYTACGDIRLCNAQPGPGSVNCGVEGKVVLGSTNALGQITLTVIGAAINTGNGGAGTPGCGPGAIVVRAEGVTLDNATSWVSDQNGALSTPAGSTLSGTDLSVLGIDVARRALGGPNLGRGDINQSGDLSGTDLSSLGVLVSASAISPNPGSKNCTAIPSTYCP